MQTLHWQKSTYSGDNSNCVETATTPTTIHIRESDEPEAILTTGSRQLGALISALRGLSESRR